MSIDELKKFCAPESQRRPQIENPFSQGEHTFATDGRILVRIPRVPEVREIGPGLENVLNKFPSLPIDWTKLPPLPEPETVACPTCGGDGKYVEFEGEPALPCLDCDATGRADEIKKVKLAHRTFNAKYLRPIAALPNHEVAEMHGSDRDPMPFRFDGGDGLVMGFIEY